MVNLGFVGRQEDAEAGLYQLGARWYNPDLGRFASVDPVSGSLNQYAYGNNNPYVFADPDGKNPVAAALGLAGLCIGGAAVIGIGVPYAIFEIQAELQDVSPEEKAAARKAFKISAATTFGAGAGLLGAGGVAALPEAGIYVSARLYTSHPWIMDTVLPLANALLVEGPSSPSVSPTTGIRAGAVAGEIHHPITKKIAQMLNRHPTLEGKFTARDPRWKFPANPGCHSGYCNTLHRNIERQAESWLDKHDKASEQEFLDFLNSLYAAPEVSSRVPNVHMTWGEE